MAGKAYLKITLLVKTPLNEIGKLHAPGDGLLVKLNFGIAYGRTFHRGKSVEKYMRLLIVNDILSGGGNVLTEHYPGSF